MHTPEEALMLTKFEAVERVMPDLLDDVYGWQSLLVNDELPMVERVWRPWEDGRLYLHVIHSCALVDALFHPHRWPAAFRIHKNGYFTATGLSVDGEPPEPGPEVFLPEGYLGVLADPRLYHLVRPAPFRPAFTTMLTGRPYDKALTPGTRKGSNLYPLSARRIGEILALGRSYYPR